MSYTAQTEGLKATVEIEDDGQIHKPGLKSTVEAEKTAQAFLEQHGSNLHPALDASQPALTQSTTSVTTPIFKSFKESSHVHTEQFFRAVEAYRDSWQDPQIRALSVRKHHSWDEVMQAAREAEEKYLSAGQAGWRKWARKLLASNKWRAEALLRDMSFHLRSMVLEPDAFYVLRSLIRIPDVILLAEEACANFGPHESLNAKAEALYVAALAALEGAIKWLSRKAAAKPFRAVVLGPTYNKSFEDKMANLDESLDILESQVSTLRDGSICRTESGVKELQVDIKQIEQLQIASKTAIERMKEVLADSNRQAKWMKQKDSDIRRLKERVKELEYAAATLTEDDLRDILAVIDTHPAVDLQQITRRTDPNAPESHQALSVAASDQFKHWHEEDTSLAIFIEGGLPLSTRRISSLALVSSQVISRYIDSPHAVPIYFFCSHHEIANDPLSGPLGMIRSLIHQLLNHFSLTLDFISTRQRPLLEKLNFRALCECFSKLVKQIPASAVVFCIIDGISFFETRSWLDDTVKVIGQLHWLVNDSDTKAIFKLLVTSPNRSKHVKFIFEPEDQMSLVSGGGRRRATERDIAMARKRSPALLPQLRQTGSETALSGGELESDLRRYAFGSGSDSDAFSI